MSKVKYYVRIGTLTFGIWVRIPEKWFYSKFTRRFWTMQSGGR